MLLNTEKESSRTSFLISLMSHILEQQEKSGCSMQSLCITPFYFLFCITPSWGSIAVSQNLSRISNIQNKGCYIQKVKFKFLTSIIHVQKKKKTKPTKLSIFLFNHTQVNHSWDIIWHFPQNSQSPRKPWSIKHYHYQASQRQVSQPWATVQTTQRPNKGHKETWDHSSQLGI